LSNEGHWYGKPREEGEWDTESLRRLRVQNVQTVVNRGWDQLEPREGVSEEHVKLLLPQERAPQVVDRLVYQERPVTNEILVETQVGVPKEEIKYFDNILEKEVVKEQPVYIEKEVIKYEDRIVYQDVERIKEIPVEVEKVVYSEKIIPQEVVIEVPKPVYVDRIVYKDREVMKEVVQEVHVEVEVEKINYVNQLVEKEVKKIIEVPVEEVRYEDRVTKKIVEKVVYKDREIPTSAVKEVPKYIEVEKVRYVDKPVEKVVKVDRNVYKDNIIEVEKTVYVDVPVEMENTVTEVQEKFTEVPVEVVVFKDRVVEVPVEKVVFKDNVQTVTQEKVVEKVVDKIVEVPRPGKKGAYTKDWSAEIAAAKNELAMLQRQLAEAENAKITKTPPSTYMAGDAYNEVISPMQESQVQQKIISPMAQPMDMNLQPSFKSDSGRMCGIGMLLGKYDGANWQDSYIYVLKLVPGGPAALCGNIQVDDVLYKVDGTNVSGMELDQVFMLVRGMEDTPITLEFGRQGGKYKITLYRKGADYASARRSDGSAGPSPGGF